MRARTRYAVSHVLQGVHVDTVGFSEPDGIIGGSRPREYRVPLGLSILMSSDLRIGASITSRRIGSKRYMHSHTRTYPSPNATMSIPFTVRVEAFTPTCTDIAAGPLQELGTYILEHMTQIFRHGSRQPLVYAIVVPLAHLHVTRIDQSEEGKGIILLILKIVLLKSVNYRHITFPIGR